MNTKKLAGAALAALVGLGLFGAIAPASAAVQNGDATITLTGGSIVGHTFDAYKLANYDNLEITGGSVTGFDLVTVDDDLKTAIKVWVAQQDENYTGDAYNNIDPLQWIAIYWGNTNQDAWDDDTSAASSVRALANFLTQALANGDITLDPATSEPVEATAVSDDITATFNVKEGLYLIIETTTPDGVNEGGSTNSLPIIIGTPFINDATGDEYAGGPSGEIDIKGDLVPFDKDIVNAIDREQKTNAEFDGSDRMSELGEEEDYLNAYTGQEVTFVIRTRVPDYPDSYKNPVFQILDSWSSGLANPLPTDFAVTGVDGAVLKDAEGVAITSADWGVVVNAAVPAVPGEGEDPGTPGVDANFVLKLNDPARWGGQDIEVTYTAKVLAGGTVETWDTNQAQAEFTNLWWDEDENGPTTDRTPIDEVDLYTFPLYVYKADLVSYDPDAFTSSDFLQAQFSVKDAEGNLVGVINTSNTGVTSGTDGYVLDPVLNTPKGLPGDAWYLVEETKQPDGYTSANTKVANFWVYIGANAQEGEVNASSVLSTIRYVYEGTENGYDDGIPTGSPEAGNPNPVYIRPAAFNGDGTEDFDVLVLNAMSASEMPETGGQILLWVTIAGVLGLGAVSFAVIGIRKSRAESAHVA